MMNRTDSFGGLMHPLENRGISQNAEMTALIGQIYALVAMP